MSLHYTPLPDRLQSQAATPATEFIMKVGMFVLGAVCALLVVACIWMLWQYLVAQKLLDSSTSTTLPLSNITPVAGITIEPLVKP